MCMRANIITLFYYHYPLFHDKHTISDFVQVSYYLVSIDKPLRILNIPSAGTLFQVWCICLILILL